MKSDQCRRKSRARSIWSGAAKLTNWLLCSLDAVELRNYGNKITVTVVVTVILGWA
jgi:hypothetical protein